MSYEDYENAIIEILQIPGCETKPLPLVSALNAPRTGKPRIFVILNGSTFSDQENLAVVSQLETIQGEISIWAAKRRGNNAIYALIEKITEKLLGYKLPNAKDKITFTQFGYVNEQQGAWQYALQFTFTRYKVQKYHDEQPTGTITKIMIND